MHLTSDPLYVRAHMTSRLAEAEAHRRASRQLGRVRTRTRLGPVRARLRIRRPRRWRLVTDATGLAEGRKIS